MAPLTPQGCRTDDYEPGSWLLVYRAGRLYACQAWPRHHEDDRAALPVFDPRVEVTGTRLAAMAPELPPGFGGGECSLPIGGRARTALFVELRVVAAKSQQPLGNADINHMAMLLRSRLLCEGARVRLPLLGEDSAELLVERIEANYDEPPCAYAAQQLPRQLKQQQDVAEAALRSSKHPPKQKQKKSPRKSKKPPPVSS